jgi:hypothetical protein
LLCVLSAVMDYVVLCHSFLSFGEVGIEIRSDFGTGRPGYCEFIPLPKNSLAFSESHMAAAG